MTNVPKELGGVQKASNKMINIWMLRWSLMVFIFAIGIVLPFWMMFAMEFDEVTGEPVNFDLWRMVLSVILVCLAVLVISLGAARAWASLYWKRYNFQFLEDRIVITRGVIGRKVTNIQYERIQNVNVWKGILERIFGLSSVMIETAGGTQMQMANYGAFSFSEGTIQGIFEPQPIVDYLLRRAKGGRDALTPAHSDTSQMSKERKLELLEERLLKGEISEQTFKELKKKYEA